MQDKPAAFDKMDDRMHKLFTITIKSHRFPWLNWTSKKLIDKATTKFQNNQVDSNIYHLKEMAWTLAFGR